MCILSGRSIGVAVLQLVSLVLRRRPVPRRRLHRRPVGARRPGEGAYYVLVTSSNNT